MSVAHASGGLRSVQRAEGELHMVLNNSLDAIEAGRLELLMLLGDQPPAVVNRVEVIFEELVANVVRHGFADGADHSLHVWARLSPGLIELDFEDDGAPFNPFDQAEPTPFTTLDAAQVGGLGIPLVRRLAASVAYEYAPPHAFWGTPGQGAVNRTLVTVSTT